LIKTEIQEDLGISLIFVAMRIFFKKLLSLHIIILLFLCLGFSCQEKDDPSNGKANITISGLELLNPLTYPSAKLAAENSWNHEFENKLALTFESGTGEKYGLEINPNDFSKPYSIALPLGNYKLRGSSIATDPFAKLSIQIIQNLAINSSDQKIIIRATSDYGLFSITNENLGNTKPEDIATSRKLELKGKFYYRYALANSEIPIKVPLGDGKHSFNMMWKAKSFTHRHISLDHPSNPNDIATFLPTNFDIDQAQILLTEQGLPTALSPVIQAELPISQNETSGLAFIQGRLFSINDSGNSNDIFELNPTTGAVIRTIKVTNSTNNDWEDLAQSDTHLFIGDFGNNNGSRKDLSVLKIPITSVLGSTEVIAEKLSFTFSDQTDFTGNGGIHNYDCEAFFFSNNLLHLFTKNWADQKTKHYTMSPTQSNSIANLIGSFDVKGLITGAGIDSQGNICLLGYENAGFTSRSFVWLFSGYSGTDFFSGKAHRIFLGSPSQLSQTEGVIFDQIGQVKITGEQISIGGITIPAKLSQLDLRGLF
jgi:hypothetical protein